MGEKSKNYVRPVDSCATAFSGLTAGRRWDTIEKVRAMKNHDGYSSRRKKSA
jgi:hypothetical protein